MHGLGTESGLGGTVCIGQEAVGTGLEWKRPYRYRGSVQCAVCRGILVGMVMCATARHDK